MSFVVRPPSFLFQVQWGSSPTAVDPGESMWSPDVGLLSAEGGELPGDDVPAAQRGKGLQEVAQAQGG